MCRTSITGAIFRAASCRGIRKKKGEEIEALARIKEHKDDYNKITAISFCYLFCYTKNSELKYVWVIILILRSKNRFINKALNKFEKK